MPEQKILNSIAKCYPTKSSYKKLVVETGMARNEVEEVVIGLKKIGYVNVTPKSEIYLIEDGKNYLGVSSIKPENNNSVSAKPATNLPSKDEQQLQEAIEASKTIKPVSDGNKLSTEQHSVLASIDILEEKLNKPKQVVEELDLKGQALTRLASLMSDDIAKLLIDIKDDLERVAA